MMPYNQNGCACLGTYVDPCAANGGDADGDGVCAPDDCDDNDINIGAIQPAGTTCDDGNPNTTNDVYLADGCTCLGEPIDSTNTGGGEPQDS